MVLFYLVHKHSHNVRMFVNKIGIFRPAGGDIPHQTQDYLIHGSSGRFAGFAHVVLFVVQMPTA